MSAISYTEIDTSMLYVPIVGYKPFDDALETAFKKYWKVTSYKIVSLKEYKRMDKENEAVRSKPKAVESDKAARERMMRDQKAMKYSLFYFGQRSFVFGKTHASGDSQGKDEYLPPLENLDDESSFTKYVSPKGIYKMGNILHKIEYMVKCANDVVAFTLEKKLEAESNVMYGVAGAVFNEKAPLIKDRTLLINADARSTNGVTVYKQDAFEKYPYPYKFVSSEEFFKVLDSESKEYVCLMTLPGGLSFIMVYEPATRSNLYYEYAPRRGGFEKFKEDNAEDLVKRIKGISLPVKRLLPMDK
jgi:hypothetical protein